MPIRELIKEYRGRIWIEAYCHPVGDHDESDSVLDKIESELKELEEKAESFDLLSENNSAINHSFISGNTHMAIDLEDGQKELLVEGKGLLECVRKARGEE